MPPKEAVKKQPAALSALDSGSDLVGGIMAAMTAGQNSGNKANLKGKARSKGASSEKSDSQASDKNITEAEKPASQSTSGSGSDMPAAKNTQASSDAHVASKSGSAASGNKSSSSSSRKDKNNDNNLAPTPGGSDADWDFVKASLINLTKTVHGITPVVMELKSAYDNYQQADDLDLVQGGPVLSDAEGSDASEEEGEVSDHEPPVKKGKSNFPGIETSILGKLGSSVKSTDKTGPNIDSQLSEVVSQLLQNGMNKDTKSAVVDNYPKPGNCARLDVVRVNPEIFNSNNIKKETKNGDVMLQRVQRPLVAGLTAVVTLMDKLVQAEKGVGDIPSSQDILNHLSDATSLLADSSHELDLRRRAGFRPELKEEFKSLCGESEPITDLLFGSELGSTVKNLSDTSKVTKQITGKMKTTKGRGFTSNNAGRPGTTGRRFPFLGGPPRGRGGYQYRPYPQHYNQSQWQTYGYGQKRGDHFMGKPRHKEKGNTHKHNNA